MVIASNYQIKEGRKTLNMIFENLFKYSMNGAECHIDLGEALHWFTKIEIAKQNKTNPGNQNMSRKVVLCMTSDGFRSGQMNMHVTSLRGLEEQSSSQHLILACRTGPDDHEHALKYTVPLYKRMEELCKTPILIDDILVTVSYMCPADMKEAWGIGQFGSQHDCLFCCKKLGAGGHCKLRPACKYCKISHPERMMCRHFPEMFREEDIEPDFEPLIIPRNLNDANVSTLISLAQSLNIPVKRDDSNRNLKKDDLVKAIENWVQLWMVSIDTYTKDDVTNILNASLEAIDRNLRARYPNPVDYANVLDSDACVEDKRAVLLQCLLAEERFQYWRQFNGSGIDELKALVMDILHCRIRIKNSLLTELIKSLLSRNLTTEVKKRRVEGIQGVLRDVYNNNKSDYMLQRNITTPGLT
jgi:hypothetical protein